MPPETGCLPASDLTADDQANYYWMPPAPAASAAGRTGARGSAARLPYLPGLDGLRAFAVIAVLIYHGAGGWLPGGYLGVEIFFVLSGYLITSLLLAEWRQRGRIDLKAFWLRRARRLLPALYFLLLLTLTYAVIFLPGEVANMRSAAVAAFFYVTNWYLIFHHESYFQAVGRPPILQHLWSLAVEEQFYLVWPLLFTGGMMLWRRRHLFYAVLGGALLSSIWMAYLFHPTLDPSRLYYGTDTRAAELLIGAALAFVWEPGRLTGRNGMPSARLIAWLDRARVAPYLLDGLGTAAVVGLLAFCRWLTEYDPFLYRGGYLAAALTTAVVIAVVAHPRARLVPRGLGWRPLRYVGTRSYGIYLWHWPIFMVTRPQLDIALGGLPLLALRLGLTLLLAECSYRFVETPIRHGALGRAWRALREATGERRRRLGMIWVGATGAASLSIVVLGVAVAAAQPPPLPSYLKVTEVHTRGLPDATGTPGATGQSTAVAPFQVVRPASSPTVTPTPTPTPSPTPHVQPTPTPRSNSQLALRSTPTPTPTSAPAPTPTPTTAPTPTPSPTPPPAQSSQIPVNAFGDSVMIGGTPDLQSEISNLTVDAVQGLQVPNAIGLMQQRKAAGELGEVVVVHLGDNGYFTSGEFDQIMQTLSGVRKVIFVNVKVPRQWESANNAVISNGVQRYANTVLVDWHDASENHPEYFWDDGIHLRPNGAEVYANLISAEVKQVEASLQGSDAG